MNRDQAEALVGEFLRPLPPSDFFSALGRQVISLTEGPKPERASLFGVSPGETALGAFATHSGNLEYHSPAPNGPPPPVQVANDATGFHSLIRAYHQRGYTVRIPDVVSLSAPLQRLCRAIECLLEQPTSAALFWSYAGARAQIHYDNRDNLVVQLEGRKRWFISTEPPALYNDWMQLGAPPPQLREPQVIDVEPGDVLYVPRGTPHSVESTTESLHVAILFNPVTVRELLIAAIDLLSDGDRTLRETALSPGAEEVSGVLSRLEAASQQLADHCRSAAFVERAMEHRSARVIGDLLPLDGRGSTIAVDDSAVLAHSPLAIGLVRRAANYIGFAQPGGQFAIHPGVEPEMRFIANTPQFRVSEIPGNSGPDVRKALVQRLVSSGFLEVVR